MSADNVESEVSIKPKANVESYRCNLCSIDFQLVDDLFVHTQQEHSDPERGVTCGKCQVEFRDVSEFIQHHRSQHFNGNCSSDNKHAAIVDGCVKSEATSLECTAGEGENRHVSVEIPDQITIVNDSGEAIGIAECEDVVAAAISNELVTSSQQISSFASLQSNPRKRHLPLNFRDVLVDPGWRKPSDSSNSDKSSLDIDVSGCSSIRLKTKSDDDQQNIIEYLERVERKLDCIIKHFNVPLNNIGRSHRTGNISLANKPFKKSSTQKNVVTEPTIDSSITTSINENIMHHSNNIPTNACQSQEVGYVTCHPANLPEITQYVVADELLESIYMRSRNRGNFAKNLVYAAFPLEERLGRNCYGRRGGSVSGPKGPLEAAKLEAVREAVFKKFPILDGDDPDAVWKRECVVAIDTALRSEMRTRILNMQNSMKSEIKNTVAMNVTM